MPPGSMQQPMWPSYQRYIQMDSGPYGHHGEVLPLPPAPIPQDLPPLRAPIPLYPTPTVGENAGYKTFLGDLSSPPDWTQYESNACPYGVTNWCHCSNQHTNMDYVQSAEVVHPEISFLPTQD